MELTCVVVGYRTGRRGLRDLQLATVVEGKLTYVGTVELGVEQGGWWRDAVVAKWLRA